ncbi:Lipoprotein [Hyphomicrobium sp. 1Nfss2.1]
MRVIPMREAGIVVRKARLAVARLAGVAAGLTLGGCASTMSTPLPELTGSHASTSLTQQQQRQAVDELTRAGATHEHQAEQEIENSR